MNPIRTKVYCCFPGTGKSYMKQHEEEYGLKILDSDSSEFHWIYQDGKKIENPNFIEDYISHIEKEYNSNNYDIIFMSTHSKVISRLMRTGIPFSIFIPSLDCKGTYLKNYEARGNDSAFIKRLDEHWEEWLTDIKKWDDEEFHSVLILREGDYLGDFVSVLSPKTLRMVK